MLFEFEVDEHKIQWVQISNLWLRYQRMVMTIMDREHDPHFWLDPVNAKAMVRAQSQLSSIDPANATLYESNAKNTEARLDELVTEIEAELAGLQGRGFIAFHDAYQYFENRFGVQALGTVTVSPDVMPGA